MIEPSSAGPVVPALLDGVGIGIGRRPIIDPLLQDGRLVPLFRDRAIGKAAHYLLQRRRVEARRRERWRSRQDGKEDERTEKMIPRAHQHGWPQGRIR